MLEIGWIIKYKEVTLLRGRGLKKKINPHPS
jgi:hypothetical protein